MHLVLRARELRVHSRRARKHICVHELAGGSHVFGLTLKM